MVTQLFITLHIEYNQWATTSDAGIKKLKLLGLRNFLLCLMVL